MKQYLMCIFIPLMTWAQTDEVNPVPPLLRNLEATSPRVAASAARSLGVIFSPGGRSGDEVKQVTDALMGTLGATSANVRRESASALGAMLSTSALGPLKETVMDAD